MFFKFDKNVWMNFLHSFFGGIFGGMVIAFSLGQSPKKGTIGYYIVFLFFMLILALLGILIMAHLNYKWEKAKGRIHKKAK